MSREPADVPVPKSLRYASIGVLLASVAMVFLGAVRIGVTWDEPIHVQRLDTYLHTGWYLTDAQLVDGEPGPEMTQQYVYAPAAMLLLHGLCVVTGVETPGSTSVSAEAYAVRHVGIGLLSVLGLMAVAATGRLLLRRWDWGLVAAATLAAVPLWTGHSMFNLKDVPVATGYALATLGLALLARSDEGPDGASACPDPSPLRQASSWRWDEPGMWTGMFASVFVLLCCFMLKPRAGTRGQMVRADWWRYRDLILALIVSGLALWVVYPKTFDSPLVAMWRAAFSSANFLTPSRSGRLFLCGCCCRCRS